jgi:hypothetical protein
MTSLHFHASNGRYHLQLASQICHTPLSAGQLWGLHPDHAYNNIQRGGCHCQRNSHNNQDYFYLTLVLICIYRYIYINEELILG